MTENDLWSLVITLGEWMTYLLTPLAEMPYSIKIVNVIAMNMRLRINISNIGAELFGDTKSGRNAKKKIDN